MFFHEYPFLQPNELNLDWLLQHMKELVKEFLELQNNYNSLEEKFEDLKTWLQTWVDQFDIGAEVQKVLDEWFTSGKLLEVLLQLQQGTWQEIITTYEKRMILESYPVGTIFQTCGYYSVNDGGQAEYIVVDSSYSGPLLMYATPKGKIIPNVKENRLNLGAMGYTPRRHDNASMTMLQELIVGLPNYTLVLPAGEHVFSKRLILRQPTSVTFEGACDASHKNIGTLIHVEDDSFMDIYGCENFYVRNLKLVRDPAECTADSKYFWFRDDSYTTANCRVNYFYLEHVYSLYAAEHVAIDAPTGYMYFNHFYPYSVYTDGYGVTIGRRFANTKSVVPNYIYFTNCNFDINPSSDRGWVNLTGIGLFGATNISINKCDFTGDAQTGIVMNPQTAALEDIRITDNNFFDCNGVITNLDAMTRICQNLLIANNNFGCTTALALTHGIAFLGEGYVQNAVVNANTFWMYYLNPLPTDFCDVRRCFDVTWTNNSMTRANMNEFQEWLQIDKRYISQSNLFALFKQTADVVEVTPETTSPITFTISNPASPIRIANVRWCCSTTRNSLRWNVQSTSWDKTTNTTTVTVAVSDLNYGSICCKMEDFS